MEVKYAAVQQKRDGETLSGYRKEIGILRKQNSDLSSSVVQHQTKIQGLVKDLRADRAKLEEGQSNLARAKSELRIVKESEQRLSRECAALMEEKQRSVALMATLDKIQTSLRKKDEESHRSVLQEKKEMHAELEAVRERYAKAQVPLLQFSVYTPEIKIIWKLPDFPLLPAFVSVRIRLKRITSCEQGS